MQGRKIKGREHFFKVSRGNQSPLVPREQADKQMSAETLAGREALQAYSKEAER